MIELEFTSWFLALQLEFFHLLCKGIWLTLSTKGKISDKERVRNAVGLGEECRKFLILSVLINKLGFPGSSGFCLYEHLLFPFSVQGVGLMVTLTQQSSSLGHRFRPKTQKSISSLHWKHSCLTVLPQVASKNNHLLCFKRPSIAWLKTTFKFPKE